MKRLFAVFFMLSLMVACSSVEDIPDFYGVINGTVMHKEQPVEGVEVVIAPGGNSFVTKSNGSYLFENLESGSYTLTFRKKGYKTVTKNVNVSAGVNNQVDVNLDIDGNLVKADTDILDFGKSSKVMTFNIINQLDKVVSWEIRNDNLPDWVSLKSLSGNIPSNSENPISVTVDRSKIKGENDSFSLDIDVSTGNKITVLVSVEAGKVGTLSAELYYLGYDNYMMTFTMGENCTKFCVVDYPISNATHEDVMRDATYYEDDDYVINFDCKDNPGVPHYLYVIAFNEFGQSGEMSVYKIDLLTEPAPEVQYTALKDIKGPGIYNVKNAYVMYADGWRAILTDDNGYTLFYMYFDSSYASAHPQTGEIIELSGEVQRYHNMLEFMNPEYVVTGYAEQEDILSGGAIDTWDDNYIADGSDMTAYCKTSNPDIRIVSLVGTITSTSGSNNCNLIVEGTGVVGNIFCSDMSKLKKYSGKTVLTLGMALGYYEYSGKYYIDILAIDTEEVQKPTYESYEGYWNATAYNVDTHKWETWENMYLETYINSDTGKKEVCFYGWMVGYGYDFFRSYGYYDESTGDIVLKGSYGGGTYYYDNDKNTLYQAYFYPIYVIDENDSYMIGNTRNNECSTALLKYTDLGRDSMELAGDELYPDEDGLVANGFSFHEMNITTNKATGWFEWYKDVTFTRSQNPPANPSYSRSRGASPRNCVEIHQSEKVESMDKRKVSEGLLRSL
jgi:hypothetical protein